MGLSSFQRKYGNINLGIRTRMEQVNTIVKLFLFHFEFMLFKCISGQAVETSVSAVIPSTIKQKSLDYTVFRQTTPKPQEVRGCIGVYVRGQKSPCSA